MKKIIYGIALVLAVFVGVLFGKGSVDVLPQQVNTEVVQEVSILLDYNNGTIETHTVAIEEGMSLFDALEDLQEEGVIELTGQDYGGDLGYFLQAIDGVGIDDDSGRWWQVWSNNQYLTVGVSSYMVNTGDIIMFKYAHGQES